MTLRSQIEDLRYGSWVANTTDQNEFLKGAVAAYDKVLALLDDEDETGFAIHKGAEVADSLIEVKRG